MAPSWLQPFLDWLALHPTAALLVVFLIALSESLLIVGMLVPGAVLMLGVGSLVALGHLEFWSATVSAIAGAVLGDGVSYWFGYFFKDRVRDAWPFRHHPQLLERGERFFIRHGGKSIVFGRFVGPLRAVIPTIAGILGMTPVRFTLINVASAIAWAPAYILPGMAIGVALELASQVAARLGVFILGLLATSWILIVSVRQIFRWVQPRAAAWISSMLVWSQHHRYLGWFARAMLDPRNPEAGVLSGLAALFIFSAWAFTAFLVQAAVGSSILGSDIAVFNVFQTWRTPIGDTIMVTLSMIFDKFVVIPLGLSVMVYLLAIREWRTALYWLGTVVVGIVIASVIKLWVRVPRPLELYEGISAYAFPSAHVTTVCVVLTFFAVIVAGSLRRYRGFPYTLVVVIVFGVAVSRLYLGAHWLSDVLGGIALALAWVSAVGLTYRQHCAPLKRIWPIIIVACATWFVAASWHLSEHFDAELNRYTPPMSSVPQIDAQAWWQSGWATLPAQRVDVRGKPSTPLTVQYAGDIDALRTMLQQRGWNVPSNFSLQSTLLWFNPNADIGQLPVLPNVNDQRHEAFRMVLDLDPQHRIVLRLWNSAITTGTTPGLIYVGTVTQETIVEILHTLRFAKAGPDTTHALNVFQAFVAEWPHKNVPRAAVHDPKLRWQWDGQALLLRQLTDGS